MARRFLAEDRCGRCFLRKESCLCLDLPLLRLLHTRLTVIMHAAEFKSTTNTGRLLQLAIPECQIVLRGEKENRFSGLCFDEPTVLFLYPTPDSIELTPHWVAALPKPIHLVVPDGTWRQAAKVYRREPSLQRARPVKLMPGPISGYHLRTPPQPHCLSTVEATARALGLWEGEAVQKALENLFALMVKRTLETRTPDSWRAKGLVRNAAGDFIRQEKTSPAGESRPQVSALTSC